MSCRDLIVDITADSVNLLPGSGQDSYPDEQFLIMGDDKEEGESEETNVTLANLLSEAGILTEVVN